MFKLPTDSGSDFAITLTGSAEGEFTKKFGFFLGRERISVFMIGGEPVAQVFKGELKAVGEALGVVESFGVIVEEGGDLRGGLEMALWVGFQEGARLVEGGVVAQTGEGVSEEAIAAAGEKRGVGCEEGEFEVTGEIDQEAVASFFAADMVPGEGEVEVFWAEGVAKPDSGFEEVGFCGIRERFRGQEGNQTFGLRAESGREGNFGSGFCALRR